SFVQRVDRPALGVQVAGFAHRTDQLPRFGVTDDLLLRPVRQAAKLAPVPVLETREDRGQTRPVALSTDGHAQPAEGVLLRSRRRIHARRGRDASNAPWPPKADSHRTRA